MIEMPKARLMVVSEIIEKIESIGPIILSKPINSSDSRERRPSPSRKHFYFNSRRSSVQTTIRIEVIIMIQTREEAKTIESITTINQLVADVTTMKKIRKV